MIDIKQGDCLELMKALPNESVDLILCDLPYGTTQCSWDTQINLGELWTQYKRIIKENGAIVLTATQPFASILIWNNIKIFKYEWIWEKTHPNGYLNSKKQPMRKTENILIFYKQQCTYNPQGLVATVVNNNRPAKTKKIKGEYVYGQEKSIGISQFKNYPTNLLKFPNPNNNTKHPTQKPLELFEYLIKTYTNEGDVVLDNCMGSGTTGVACINTKRNFIGLELDQEYFNIAKKRIEDATKQVSL